jgi:hypothetical protein
LAVGVVGIVFTVAVLRAFDRYDDPGPHDAHLSDCTVNARGVVTVAGTIENLGTDTQTYSVLVRIRQAGRSFDDRIVVEDVRPGATAPFDSRTPTGARRERTPDCRILDVNGPLPLGLDPELFD